MPITALSLTKRSDIGAALSQAQFDNNLSAIQTAVNALIVLAQLALKEDGDLKDGHVKTAAQVTNSILTLAKLAALTGADKGGFLRADATTGVIAAAHLASAKLADSSAVTSTGATASLPLASLLFEDLPPGDVMIWAKLSAKRNAGANGGTINLKSGATVIDQVATHGLDGAGTSWLPFLLVGRLPDFAGGDLTLDLDFETSEASSDVTFGVDGEGRFGRSITLLAGL